MCKNVTSYRFVVGSLIFFLEIEEKIRAKAKQVAKPRFLPYLGTP